ncbi:glutathione S-transferase family protein [Shumkonia mesophila]|uniref:glutathione S-transferase family protein n=1 Tax=Shumkonia mesophila TaxID=2838854 RepID=UPI002934F152|nr:glutathione S-transferase family protein [Shumkonia mesophila]
MGLLVDGIWRQDWYDTETSGGRFVRPPTRFRGRITADGSSGFPAEPGRYHLYVSYACPWAHRTLIFRALKGLADKVSVSVAEPLMGRDGWTLAEGADPVMGARFLYDVYRAADRTYTGRVTVPVLWDKQTGTIVSNESADIIRMFNSAFDAAGAAPGDYYPEPLRAEIDALNARIYDTVNNGVYRAGFATRQEAYDEAVTALFESLDWLEDRLSRQRYVAGDRLTEADWRLFTTLARFDAVYHGHFKCNLKRLVDYPSLWAFARELYQVPGVAATVRLDHIKAHYYGSHSTINPTGIVPKGPLVDFTQPHGRDMLFPVVSR